MLNYIFYVSAFLTILCTVKVTTSDNTHKYNTEVVTMSIATDTSISADSVRLYICMMNISKSVIAVDDVNYEIGAIGEKYIIENGIGFHDDYNIPKEYIPIMPKQKICHTFYVSKKYKYINYSTILITDFFLFQKELFCRKYNYISKCIGNDCKLIVNLNEVGSFKNINFISLKYHSLFFGKNDSTIFYTR